jgi:hypothetical protein
LAFSSFSWYRYILNLQVPFSMKLTYAELLLFFIMHCLAFSFTLTDSIFIKQVFSPCFWFFIYSFEEFGSLHQHK